MPTARVERARAYAPGHVTGIFLPDTTARDPRARGSLGAGLVLDAGVVAEAEWRPAHRPGVRVVSPETPNLRISVDVAERLGASRPGSLVVRLRHGLPVGQGFGMSAAGATATALAVARLVGASRDRAIATAHLADLFGRGGLGGVAAILGGGFEIRLLPGIPPFGRSVRRPCRPPVVVGVVGRPVPSPRVLRSERALARIRRAADVFNELRRAPTLERFWDASESFTDAAGLASKALRDALRALRRRRARACQAMLGGSFFASLPGGDRRDELLEWMYRRGIRAVELPVASFGARLVPMGLLRTGP